MLMLPPLGKISADDHDHSGLPQFISKVSAYKDFSASNQLLLTIFVGSSHQNHSLCYHTFTANMT